MWTGKLALCKDGAVLLSSFCTWDVWPKRKWFAMCDANRLKTKKENISSSCLPSPLLSCILTSQLVGILFLKLQIWGSFIILVISRWLLMPNLTFSISRSPKFLLESRWNFLLCTVCCWRSIDKPASPLEAAGQKTHVTCHLWNMPHLLLASHSLWVWVFFLKEILLPVQSIVEMGCRWRSCCGLTCRKLSLLIGSRSSRKWHACRSQMGSSEKSLGDIFWEEIYISSQKFCQHWMHCSFNDWGNYWQHVFKHFSGRNFHFVLSSELVNPRNSTCHITQCFEGGLLLQ